MKTKRPTRKGKSARLGLRQLADALGVDKGQLSRESKRAGFPRPIKGTWSLGAVQQWRASNVRSRLRDEAPAAASVALTAEDRALIGTLTASTSSPLMIARASVGLAARKLGAAAQAGRIGAMDLSAMADALRELRQSENAFLDISERQKTVAPIDDVREYVGECITKILLVFERMETSVAAEIESWLGDPTFMSASMDQRMTRVRSWIHNQGNELRRMEAESCRRFGDGTKIE